MRGSRGEIAPRRSAARPRGGRGAESLRAYLENDFDPVPCSACGHYQHYMFPRLYEGAAWGQLARLVALAIGCPAAVGALYWEAV